MNRRQRIYRRLFLGFTDPRPLALFRILVSLLLLANMFFLAPYVDIWFTDQGLVPWATAVSTFDWPRFSLLQLAPHSTGFIYFIFVLHVLSVGTLLVGFYTRIASILVFLTLSSIHMRNVHILNSGDTVMRVMMFLMIFADAGKAYSLDAKRIFRRQVQQGLVNRHRDLIPIWPVRLMQLQVSTVYLSTVLWKLGGESWWNGTALYYVSRLQDFRRFPVGPLFDWIWSVRIVTWSTLLIELSLAILIWSRKLRPYVLLVGIAFHLSIEYVMNIQLFEWIMIACLVLFCDGAAIERGLHWFRFKKVAAECED